eukprot:3526345-Alexandrium_andersonii.AAC.1
MPARSSAAGLPLCCARPLSASTSGKRSRPRPPSKPLPLSSAPPAGVMPGPSRTPNRTGRGISRSGPPALA